MTKDLKDLWEVCKEIYTKMYKESMPSVDFIDMIVTEKAKEPEWFMHYYLSMERQQEIIKEICKKHKLSGWESQKVKEEVNTGCSPNSCKETWIKLTGVN